MEMFDLARDYRIEKIEAIKNLELKLKNEEIEMYQFFDNLIENEKITISEIIYFLKSTFGLIGVNGEKSLFDLIMEKIKKDIETKTEFSQIFKTKISWINPDVEDDIFEIYTEVDCKYFGFDDKYENEETYIKAKTFVKFNGNELYYQAINRISKKLMTDYLKFLMAYRLDNNYETADIQTYAACNLGKDDFI